MTETAAKSEDSTPGRSHAFDWRSGRTRRVYAGGAVAAGCGMGMFSVLIDVVLLDVFGLDEKVALFAGMVLPFVIYLPIGAVLLDKEHTRPATAIPLRSFVKSAHDRMLFFGWLLAALSLLVGTAVLGRWLVGHEAVSMTSTTLSAILFMHFSGSPSTFWFLQRYAEAARHG